MTYNSDELIYSALLRVGLQSNYFSGKNSPRPDVDIEGLRDEFAIARRYVLSQFTGSWCFKTVTLRHDSAVKEGWFRAPSDLVVWVQPIPLATEYDDSGLPLYRFGNIAGDLHISYIYDREDMANCPPTIVELCKWYFLYNIATRQEFDQVRVLQVEKHLLSIERAAAELCHMDKRSKQVIWPRLGGRL